MQISANFACSEIAALPIPVVGTAGENSHIDCFANCQFLVCQNYLSSSLRHHKTAVCPPQLHVVGRAVSMIS